LSSRDLAILCRNIGDLLIVLGIVLSSTISVSIINKRVLYDTGLANPGICVGSSWILPQTVNRNILCMVQCYTMNVA